MSIIHQLIGHTNTNSLIGNMEDLFGNKINEPIRYLGWKQPYAQLMLHDKYETRTWYTDYRGLVLITASKGAYNNKELLRISGEEQLRRIELFIGSDWRVNKNILNGCAIMLGRLVDCRLMAKEDENKCFVKYREPWLEERVSKKTGKRKTVKVSLYCHIYEDIKSIQPIPYEGAQGWRKIEPNFLHKIIKL